MPDRIKKIHRNGFTMIEILVVISIIGLLATMLMVRFSQVEKNSRDIVRRKSDLNQYRIALEHYATRNNGSYPTCSDYNATQNASAGLCNQLVGYIGQCPLDPREDATYYYRYRCNDSETAYLLYAVFENGNYYFICSNGASREKPANQGVPVPGDCPYVPSS